MRIDVMKTYKLYIGGTFPRSESGRSYELKDKKGNFIANPALASRKDLRDAVVAAKAAFSGWSHATAYNRGQILYRMAEMLESRTEQFVAEIKALEGVSDSVARKQVQDSIDLWVWYAGWSDKISTTSGGTNPIAGPYYNFTIPEPLGVVGVIADEKESLLGITRGLAPVITSGNTAVLIASERLPLSAISLAEVMATSDLPTGVVNILTGSKSELIPWLASHMEVDGLDISGAEKKLDGEIKRAGTENLKRIYRFEKDASLKRILSFTEYKTVWHPIGI
ncbi:MAG: aldehyde dehydrogenase [Actinobacteria bacterium]|nr:aldehyde dehydrogenase [Actinomycetota bacterium]